MYHPWNVRRLADDLIEQRVTQKDQEKYLFLWIVTSCSVFLFIPYRELWGPGFVPVLLALASFVIVGVGTSLCLRANDKGDARDFLPRFICLGMLVGIRLFVCLIAPAVIFLKDTMEKEWGYSFTVCLNPIFQVIYFWRLHHWIGVVSRKELNRDVSSAVESQAERS